MKNFLLCFILLFLTATTFAADNLYQIDLIIFTHITDTALSSENWPNILKQPYLQRATEPPFSQTLGLQSEATSLQQQPDYKIILHTSWQQKITSSRHAKWLHIYGGQPYDVQGKPIQPDDNRLPTYWELNGKLKISKDNFFDIYANLYLTIPTENTENLVPLRTFILQEHRRTKLNQLNYLDHPLFGALIKISKTASTNED